MSEPTDTETTATGETNDASDRAAFLAEMRGEGEGKAKPAKAPKSKEIVEGEPDADQVDDEETAAGTEDDEDVADKDDQEEDAAEVEETEDAAPDADKDKRLAAVQKAERRSKEQLARERQAMHHEMDARVAKLEADWKPRIEAAQRFEQLRGRVKYNTVAVLRELGLTPADFERVAQEVYAHSEAAGVKPEHKAHAERAARERELSDDLAATKKRQDKLEAELAERDQREANARAAERHFTALTKAVSDQTPLAKHFLAKTPEKTRSKFAQITLDMLDEGVDPTPAAVLKRFEKQQRAELEEIGVDPTAFIKNGRPANGKPVIDAKKKPVNGAAAKKPAELEKPLTDEEEREVILRELRERREAEDSALS